MRKNKGTSVSQLEYAKIIGSVIVIILFVLTCLLRNLKGTMRIYKCAGRFYDANWASDNDKNQLHMWYTTVYQTSCLNQFHCIVNYMQPLVDQRKILQWETRKHAVKAQNCVTIYKNWCDSLGVYEVREKSRRFFD